MPRSKMEESTWVQRKRNTEPIITSYPQKHKLELTIRFSGCFPHAQKKKKKKKNEVSKLFLNFLRTLMWISMAFVTWRKQTDQYFTSWREKVWLKRIQDRVWDLIQFHPELRLWTITAACICARIFMNLKSKAVIHPYLSKHLLHTHFKVPSTFLLFLRWLEQLYAGKSPLPTEKEMGSLPEHSIWVMSVSDRSFASAAIHHGCCVRTFQTLCNSEYAQFKIVWQTQTLTTILLSPSTFMDHLTPKPDWTALLWFQ